MTATICQACGGNVDEGAECKLCDMFSSRTPPRCHTDDTFMQGQPANGGQFAKAPHVGDFYAAQAKKHGLTSTKGKVYMNRLANFPGDPRAWVSGRGEIQKLAEERGDRVEGYGMSIPGREGVAPPATPIGVAQDILDREVAKELAKDPTLAATPQAQEDLVQRTIKRLAPHYHKETDETAAARKKEGVRLAKARNERAAITRKRRKK